MSNKPISPLRQRMIDDMTAPFQGEGAERPMSAMSRPSRPSSAERPTRPRARTFVAFSSIWRSNR